MGGLSIGLSALCLGLLWGLLRQRQKTKKLYRQMEAFLDGQKAPLEISLGESPSARLQNAAARLENALLHAREQTRLEARRSENLLTDISHQLKRPWPPCNYLWSWTRGRIWSRSRSSWSGCMP